MSVCANMTLCWEASIYMLYSQYYASYTIVYMYTVVLRHCFNWNIAKSSRLISGSHAVCVNMTLPIGLGMRLGVGTQ